MSYSYLGTQLCVPVALTSLSSALNAPLTLSDRLRAEIGDALQPLSIYTPHSLLYYPDANWLDAHWQFLKQLTYWDWLVLRQCITNGDTFLFDCRSDVYRDAATYLHFRAHELSYLAFALADAALAERVATQTTEVGLFCVTPTSEKDQ